MFDLSRDYEAWPIRLLFSIMENLIANPKSMKKIFTGSFEITCEFRYMALQSFLIFCARLKEPVDRWPTLFPFWVFAKTYEGIDPDHVEITYYKAKQTVFESNHIPVEQIPIPMMLVSIKGIVHPKPVCEVFDSPKPNAYCSDPKCNTAFYADARSGGANWNRCPKCGKAAHIRIDESTKD